jgi:thymidylate synthase
MSHLERAYLNALVDILETGEKRSDRTGTGTLSVFGVSMKFDLSRGFPAVTTKKLAWRAVVAELLWFIMGSSDERKLKEILHGDPNSDKKTIWSDNESADYWQRRKKFKGDLGRVYGVQWRTWRAPVFGANRMGVKHIDQLQILINGIKEDPYSRRHIISAWNPGELELMALPPCHMMAQFYVSADNKLSCQMYQRSADMFLGIPFNIASYALFTHMIAQACDLDVGTLTICIGDAHVYENHVEQVKEQLRRNPMPAPTLKLNPAIKNITEFTMDDIELVGYESHDAIKAPMAV